MSESNNAFRKNVENVTDKEIFEIKPIILGGSPTDQANKAVLTREEHIQAVRYWNEVIRDLRRRHAEEERLLFLEALPSAKTTIALSAKDEAPCFRDGREGQGYPSAAVIRNGGLDEK